MTPTPRAVAIVGGHGKVARLLIPLLLGRGKAVVALARTDEQLGRLAALGAIPRRFDIEHSDAYACGEALTACDAVVFAAGAGPDGNPARKRTVDLGGSLKSIAAARARGIDRFVQVSALGVDRKPEPARGEAWSAYVYAKRHADAVLRASGLCWTILRPGRLTDDAGTGRVALAPQIAGGSIPRADVAAVIASVLDTPASRGRQLDLVAGSTPVVDAVRAATSLPPPPP